MPHGELYRFLENTSSAKLRVFAIGLVQTREKLMRYKLLLLVLIIGTACGAGPFRGRVVRQNTLFPSVTGPGPGVVNMNGGMPYNGGMNINGAGYGFGDMTNAQVAFSGVDQMQISWDVASLGAFDSEPLVCPGVMNFDMGKVYRLRLTNIPNRPNLVLYPTLEINPVIPRTRSYLDHNAIPVRFTDNDFDQVQSGNFVTKVIFLPAPEFQNLAVTGGVDTIVNTQLPAGADPVVEAQNRGAVLAVIRIGNKVLDQSNMVQEAPAEMNAKVPQIPISGVNVPAFGNPNSTTPYGVPGPAVVPRAGTPPRTPFFSPINPMPATEVPQVGPQIGGQNF